jgi:SCY1-like protein 2
MLAAATSFFSRTAISQSYNVGTAPGNTGSRASTPSPNAPTSPPVAFTPTFNVGLWRVQSGSHKTTNKRVSVWSFEKRNPELEKLGPLARERTLEVLKAEVSQIKSASKTALSKARQASALGRLRHPSVLGMWYTCSFGIKLTLGLDLPKRNGGTLGRDQERAHFCYGAIAIVFGLVHSRISETITPR